MTWPGRRDLTSELDWRFLPQGSWRAVTRLHQRYAEASLRSASGETWLLAIGRPTSLGHLSAALKPFADATGGSGLDRRGESWVIEIAQPPTRWRSSSRTVHREYIQWDVLVAPTVNAIVDALRSDVPLPE